MSIEPNANLIPLIANALDQGGKPGVSARRLYEFLELNPSAWARWVRRNVTKNPYALEHEDWELLQPAVEDRMNTGSKRRMPDDYVFSIDFAKKLAMMTRSIRGEEARTYFLDCEKALSMQRPLPRVRDPKTQIAIDTLVRLDDAEYRIALLEADNRQKDEEIQRANAKADMALDDAHRMTIEEFVCANGLLRQFPEKIWPAASKWLLKFCGEYNLRVEKVETPWQSWPRENRYPLQALAAWQRYIVRTRGQIRWEGIEEDGLGYDIEEGD